MLKNYLKISIRNLIKYKAYSLINLLGLTIGLASCLLISLYVFDELNFDRFHSKADRIYRIVASEASPDQGERHYGITSAPVGPAMEAEFPGVVNSARLNALGRHTVQNGDIKFYEQYLTGEQSLFEIFDFEFVYGDREHALEEPNTVVLSLETARKYFGEGTPIGKILSSDRGHELKVTGVLNIPHNSHLQFDAMISFATFATNPRLAPYLERWDVQGFTTYLLLNEQNDIRSVQSQLPALLNRNLTENSDVARKLTLQSLSDIHFMSAHIEADRNAAKGEMAYIYILGAIAIFILLIACINYMNLATARSVNRATEVGLRKVVGAQRNQLVGQFISESMLMSFAAFLLAYALAQNILPQFNSFTGKDLSFDLSNVGQLLFGLVSITFIVGLASGSYPAFYLSKIPIVSVLKSKFKSGSRANSLRRSVVVTQFVLSIIMIVATLVTFNQMSYIRNMNLGFNKNQLVVVDINSGEVRSSFASMRNEFLQNPNVHSVSVTSRVPGEWKNILEFEVIPQGATETDARTMTFFGVDSHFLETFEVALAAGRNFIETMTTDTTAVLINEAAAKVFGWDDPINKTFTIPTRNFEAHIIGVVNDFNFRSLHEKIGPLTLGHSHNPIHSIDYFTSKIASVDIPATIRSLKEIHKKYDKVTPFEYHFLDQQLANFYKSDQRVSALFSMAAGLAIFIACLGLFGLAAFTAEQRTNEIGVRKVLGATVAQIILLLSKEFTKLVIIALFIAVPIAYFASNKWLQEFAYHIDIGLGTFLIAGLLVLIIAWSTTAYQAIKAALTNPVDALRYE